MAYPDDLLGPGERVVIHHHPHWKVLLWPVVVLPAVVGGGAYLAALVAGNSWAEAAWVALALVGAVLLAWLVLAPLVRWRTTHLVVTTDRVLYREGVLKRTGLDLPRSRISGVRCRCGPLDRLLGCGTLIIDSAPDEPLELDDIPGVERVCSALHREPGGRPGGNPGGNPGDDFHPDRRLADGLA
ncbi:membrane protein YdbS with pleckstrin-like domain [Saccharothrix coeruleofusca]|uniref:PH domain-containing protein n=1 Tax=Saccharothrix coeruleofusca TaxID=33919 RepID=UPI001AE9460E|nr:PH domain-containing protein [Saccharothrix coeruleofusca]MBP2339152.1 membrane protein YdbS with pleckstrin-like domain [Saccharothrix coeruleofusca]